MFNKLLTYYRAVLAKDAEPKKPFQIPEQYWQNLQNIINLPQQPSSQQIETALQQMREIQFKIVGDLSNELQVAVDGPKSTLRPDNTVLNTCKEIGGYQPVTWLGARDKSRNPQVYRNKTLESSNYGPIDQMIRMTNEKWQQSCLVARPAVQFRGFFPEVDNPKMIEVAQEIKETYNDYLRAARSLEDLKSQHPELIDPYIEVHSTKSQKIIYLTQLERFGALNAGLLSKDTSSSLDLRLMNNTLDREIPHSLLAMTTFDVDGKTLERPIGAVTFSSMEEYSLKAGMKLTQALVEIQPGITQERINGIYRSLDEYVEMLHQEHPEQERQTLAAALWHNAHTRDDYQTKKALLAFKLFPNEVIKQLKELQFTELKIVGLHFPTNEYGNKQWKGEEVDCALPKARKAHAIHPIPDKTGQLEDKRVLKVEGKVLAPLTGESPALPIDTQFKATIVAEPSSGIIATTPKGNTLKIGQIKSFAYREKRKGNLPFRNAFY